MVRNHLHIGSNLPQLQNFIKRDPASYKDDFLQQYTHFLSTLEVFQLAPDQMNKSLDDQVMFIAQTIQCYPEEMKKFPQTLMELLKNQATVMDPQMRKGFCKALATMRFKQILCPLELFKCYFQLLKCQDKDLRSFLENYIITDIKNIYQKQKGAKINLMIHNYMLGMLKDTSPSAAKMALDVIMECYKKNIWSDAKTVNAIGRDGCFSKVKKVQVASLRFFLGTDEKPEEESDSDDEPDIKGAILSNKVNKKTKKSAKRLAQAKKQFVKSKKKKTAAPNFNFSAIHLINNPQEMSENLFKSLQSGNERFELKLLYLDVISRLVGIHELFLFNFYPFVARYLNPHQRQVTRILQFAAQASHELVPGDVVEPVVKTICNNFVTERNSSDVMAIGLNSIREICQRCPLAMSEELLRDLVMYKTYKSKAIMMAARSLITLYREKLPDLLHKRDRGRPTEDGEERQVRQYGEVRPTEVISGAEVLLKNVETVGDDEDEDDEAEERDSDGEWENVSHSETEGIGGGNDVDSSDDEEDEFETDDDPEEEDEDSEDDSEEEEEDAEEEKVGDENGDKKKKRKNSAKDDDDADTNSVGEESAAKRLKFMDKKEAAMELAATRIFSDADFKKMELETVKRRVTGLRKKEVERDREKTEFVKLDDIEMIYKKRKNDKQTRIESVQKGRVDREKFGFKDNRKNSNCSRTNREKSKLKNPQMMRSKAKGKIKKSFRDKQLAFRNYLLKQKKMR